MDLNPPFKEWTEKRAKYFFWTLKEYNVDNYEIWQFITGKLYFCNHSYDFLCALFDAFPEWYDYSITYDTMEKENA